MIRREEAHCCDKKVGHPGPTCTIGWTWNAWRQIFQSQPITLIQWPISKIQSGSDLSLGQWWWKVKVSFTHIYDKLKFSFTHIYILKSLLLQRCGQRGCCQPAILQSNLDQITGYTKVISVAIRRRQLLLLRDYLFFFHGGTTQYSNPGLPTYSYLKLNEVKEDLKAWVSTHYNALIYFLFVSA